MISHHLDSSQCHKLFIAVGITSNISHHVLNLSRPTLSSLSAHPRSYKLNILRSGGPFDRAYGLPSVAIDRYLSVQVQVPAYKPAREEDERRERRSFAPSPAALSQRLPREERQANAGWTAAGASSSALSLGTIGDKSKSEKAKAGQQSTATPLPLSRSESVTPEGTFLMASAPSVSELM